jgi:ABC-type Mn2+/Zn2+ transport system ATPase subunit
VTATVASASREQGPAIGVEQVSLELGNTRILSDVSFSIDEGAIHCIFCENGGG